MEEALDTIQDVLNHCVKAFPKIAKPEEQEKPKTSIFKHIISFDQENITSKIIYLGLVLTTYSVSYYNIN